MNTDQTPADTAGLPGFIKAMCCTLK